MYLVSRLLLVIIVTGMHKMEKEMYKEKERRTIKELSLIDEIGIYN